MNIGRGLVLSLLAAALGVGLWIGLYLLTDRNFRLVAIAIGGLAGFGMALGNAGHGGVRAGVAAAIVTLVAVLGAQMTVCHLAITDEITESMTFTQEDAKSALAGQVYEEFEAEGAEMAAEWDNDADYPPEVIAAAEHRWDAMSATEKAEYTADLAAQWGETANGAAPMLTGISFLVNFGLMGWVFLTFGISSAFKIGSTVAKKDELAEGAMTVESVGSMDASGGFFARLGPPAEQPVDEQSAEADPTAEHKRAA